VGNKELLAVKAALEEWRHWLEGAEQPFLVWTDHTNLEYIRKAKRLARPGGHYFLVGSTSHSLFVPDPRTENLMLCLAFMTQNHLP